MRMNYYVIGAARQREAGVPEFPCTVAGPFSKKDDARMFRFKAVHLTKMCENSDGNPAFSDYRDRDWFIVSKSQLALSISRSNQIEIDYEGSDSARL